jgi:hypothetical protein
MKVANQTQLATLMNLSRVSVGKLLKAPDAPKQCERGKWNVSEVRAFWKVRQSLDKSKPAGTYAEELIAKTAAQRALLELELETKRGNLLDKDTVELRERGFVQTIQTDLLNAHTTLAQLVAGKTVPECETEIRAFMRRQIQHWAKMHASAVNE